jgi:hypothetical protein
VAAQSVCTSGSILWGGQEAEAGCRRGWGGEGEWAVKLHCVLLRTSQHRSRCDSCAQPCTPHKRAAPLAAVSRKFLCNGPYYSRGRRNRRDRIREGDSGARVRVGRGHGRQVAPQSDLKLCPGRDSCFCFQSRICYSNAADLLCWYTPPPPVVVAAAQWKCDNCGISNLIELEFLSSVLCCGNLVIQGG